MNGAGLAGTSARGCYTRAREKKGTFGQPTLPSPQRPGSHPPSSTRARDLALPITYPAKQQQVANAALAKMNCQQQTSGNLPTGVNASVNTNQNCTSKLYRISTAISIAAYM